MNLEFWRKQKGLSQAELAKLMSAIWAKAHTDEQNHYSSDMVSRMERNPETVIMVDMQVLMEALGVTSDQLLSPKYLPPQMPEVHNNWYKVSRQKKRALALIHECPNPDLAEELTLLTRSITQKPKIAFIGRPDAGKSTLQNLLLGQKENWLPTGWSPETSAICYLKHLNDRPDWAGNDKVLIFRDPQNGIFDPSCLDNNSDCEAYCKTNCIAAGGYDLLPDYASHSGSAHAEEIGAIVIYVNAPILKNCDFIDLPGFNPEGVTQKGEDANSSDLFDSRDSMLSVKTSQQADAIIYMSISNSFCYGDDAEMAKTIITSLPAIENKAEKCNRISPFGNLFILASQAMAVDRGSRETLERDILDEAAKRLWNRVQDHPAIKQRGENTGYSYSYQTLRARFFTSESTSCELTKDFFKDLARFTERLPGVQAQRVKEALQRFCDSNKTALISKLAGYKTIRDKRNSASSRLEEDEKRDKAYRAEVKQYSDKVLRRIDILARESDEAVESIYQKTINTAHIKAIIEEKGYKKNKRDMSELSNDLNSELDNKISQTLLEKSELLSGEIDKFIINLDHTFASPDLGNLSFQFDAGRAFAGGLTGVASFGALAAWAATYGSLGGYILVAKAVSLLAALGIHLGGTAAVISVVAAIGGPVVLGIGIAIISALGLITLLGGTWKKTIGNKIVKQYEKAGALLGLKNSTVQFWEDTRNAFYKCCENVFVEWTSSLKERRVMLDDEEGTTLTGKIRDTEILIEFFENMKEQFEEEDKEE